MSWFTTMNHTERRTFWGCFAGWGLDALDVQIFSLVVPTLLGVSFLHSKSEAGLIATVTLLCSALGGWLAGALADRVGRVRMLQVTVAWFAVFTLLCGLAQNAGQLLAFRALMGFGFGGEWAVGAVLIAETVRVRYRGRAVGTVQSAWAIGWAAAVGVFLLVATFTPDPLTWRVVFGVGVLPAVLVFFLRRFVPEPESQGFTYNFGRGIGAAFPALVGLLADRIGISTAIAVFAGIAYALLAVAAALLTEAPGVSLTEITPEAEAEPA